MCNAHKWQNPRKWKIRNTKHRFYQENKMKKLFKAFDFCSYAFQNLNVPTGKSCIQNKESYIMKTSTWKSRNKSFSQLENCKMEKVEDGRKKDKNLDSERMEFLKISCEKGVERWRRKKRKLAFFRIWVWVWVGLWSYFVHCLEVNGRGDETKEKIWRRHESRTEIFGIFSFLFFR